MSSERTARPRPDLGGPYPEHVAVIMDGNGRWAEQRGLVRMRGHQAGVDSVRETVTTCAELGLGSLTLYAFSRENWKRPSLEVKSLMQLLRVFLRVERRTLLDNGVRLRAIGRLQDLPRRAQEALAETEALTAGGDGMVLRLALSYGGRTEIADALRGALDAARAGELAPEEINEETLRRFLYDPETPDPDLVIRTAGEMRLSNFLLWQASYAELYVTDVCWPDFRREHMMAALAAYAGRRRKFGGLLGPADPASRNRA
ncbi:MAG: polyprenyl diphosphate synthase [Planctomycetota bacterium]